ncbi:MAG: CDP-glucose 4,6-dehydratase [Thiotrichaceae bacterium]|nr:CDP-glucose 4,6-dehydratase [Thiotrichaceae bacterium]
MPTFWQDKKVLVTGHTGFKGSWLSLWLRLLKADVTGYSLAPLTHPNLFEAAHIEREIKSLIGDIRDFNHLQSAVLKARPQIIFHLAAQPLVRASYANPLETYSSNVMGTAHILEAARQCKSVKAVVIVTTDKCYENREWVWGYRENDPMGGDDPYSSSKGCAELVTQAYQRSYFNSNSVGIASARAGNVIGGGDWAEDRLIPDFIKSLAAKQKIVLRNPLATRPWQHVLEPLGGYLQLAEKLWDEPAKYTGAWNFGPEESDVRSVQWVVEYMAHLWDEALPWELDKQAQPHEAQLLKLDCSKAHFHLNWKPKWSLETALQQTVDWYQAFNQQNISMQAVCLRQIHDYMENQSK